MSAFRCQFHSALRLGNFGFRFSPSAKGGSLCCLMRCLPWMKPSRMTYAASSAWLLCRLLCPSQGHWAAAEDVHQHSSPEAQRAWGWVSLAPEEQTGQAVAEAVNYFKKISHIKMHISQCFDFSHLSHQFLCTFPSPLPSTLLCFPFYLCNTHVFLGLLLTTNMYSLLLLISSLLPFFSFVWPALLQWIQWILWEKRTQKWWKGYINNLKVYM